MWGEKLQNRPLSKLNNRRFALRAMLPVNKNILSSMRRERKTNLAAFLTSTFYDGAI